MTVPYALTLAVVIGRVEPSAKKAVAWTDEDFKSDVNKRGPRKRRRESA